MPRSRNEGFTLIELMIVVVIIGVVEALAMPSIAAGLRDREANEAALDLVRLTRRARAEATGYSRAHVLRISNADDGSAEVYRGSVGRCVLNDWDAITAGGCVGNTMCVDSVAMARDYRSVAAVRMLLEGQEWVEVCFEPSGIVRNRSVLGGTFTDRNTALGGFHVQFQRYTGDGDFGVARRVLIPIGGTARIMR